MKLIIATKNRGKLAEFKEMLAALPFEITSLADDPDFPDIEETGDTFAQNAIIKAEAVVRACGELSLADDSGLEVDALDGRPGVYSARYAGEGMGDAANNEKLLAELSGIPESLRTARFRTVIAIAAPGLVTQLVHGTIEGIIADAPQGTGGFGYDPLFYVPSTQKTFAQMTTAEKNKISHRAQAMQNAFALLKEIAAP
jgi:XTP/dITP diphosphohydrolase